MVDIQKHEKQLKENSNALDLLLDRYKNVVREYGRYDRRAIALEDVIYDMYYVIRTLRCYINARIDAHAEEL